jgi:hypothetical protein
MMSKNPEANGKSGAPLGAASADEPAYTLPVEPSQITKLAAARPDAADSNPAAREKRPGNEEPEMAMEDDLPSDGRDEKGEAMIRNLPRGTGKEK